MLQKTKSKLVAAVFLFFEAEFHMGINKMPEMTRISWFNLLEFNVSLDRTSSRNLCQLLARTLKS